MSRSAAGRPVGGSGSGQGPISALIGSRSKRRDRARILAAARAWARLLLRDEALPGRRAFKYSHAESHSLRSLGRAKHRSSPPAGSPRGGRGWLIKILVRTGCQSPETGKCGTGLAVSVAPSLWKHRCSRPKGATIAASVLHPCNRRDLRPNF